MNIYKSTAIIIVVQQRYIQVDINLFLFLVSRLLGYWTSVRIIYKYIVLKIWSLNSSTSKTCVYKLRNCAVMLYTYNGLDISIYWLLAAILILLLPLASHNIRNIYIKFIDLQNMGVAVRIVLFLQLCFI